MITCIGTTDFVVRTEPNKKYGILSYLRFLEMVLVKFAIQELNRNVELSYKTA